MSKAFRILSVLLCVLLIISMPLQTNATEGDIILRIISEEGFMNFAKNCRLDSYSENLTVLLCADLDLTGFDFTGIPSFSGTFEGNGHTISGLDIRPTGSNIGLFRYLTKSATVRNLHLEGTLAPSGSAGNVGSLAGQNFGIIENCSFNGELAGSENIGGLVGINHLTGVISDCAVNGTFHGNHFIGGIAGNNFGVVRNCQNHASVNTTVEENRVSLEDVTVDSITSSESVTTVTDIGGICGTGTGVIRDCVNYGSIGYPQIGFNIGGIAGSFSGYIYNCINHGSIDGRKEVGGIIGQLEPAVNMIYEEDTLQTLKEQLDTMSGLTGGAGASIQNASNAMDYEAKKMEEQLKDAQDAIKVLLPEEGEDYEQPDEETIQAAQNALSSSLSDLTASLGNMASIGENTLTSVGNNLQGIANQMNAIGDTVSAAGENMGGGIADISDLDTPDDISAKVRTCKNAGTVTGDWNVGGIAGAIAIENDLDPESDLQIIGNNSMNFDMELRAVILDSNNTGIVIGRKQNAGGIAGWISLGLVKQCINTATVDAASATYVGGIAGQSSGYIRNCSAKCTLGGSTYIGGIAGTAATVTDCRAIVLFSNYTENVGAILGAMDESILVSNYYLPLDFDPGAVDGINYNMQAQPLRADLFFNLENLPGIFRQVSVSFVYTDSVRRISIPYGSVLGSELIPPIEAAQGAETVWSGPIAVGDRVYHDVVFHLASTSHLTTIASDLVGASGHPQFLLQGEFLPDAIFTASATNETTTWIFTLPVSMSDMKLRCQIPQDMDTERIRVELRIGDTWTVAASHVDGKYLVSPISSEADAIRLVEIPVDYTLHWIGGTALLMLAATITLICVCKRKKAIKS